MLYRVRTPEYELSTRGSRSVRSPRARLVAVPGDEVRRSLQQRFAPTLFALSPTWEELFQDALGMTSRALLQDFPHSEMAIYVDVDGVSDVLGPHLVMLSG